MALEPKYLDRLVGPKPDAPPPFCLRCGYNLTGAVSDRCPECGHVFAPPEWKKQSEKIRHKLEELRDAPWRVRLAFRLALGALIGLLLCCGLSFAVLEAMLRFGGGLAGFVAILLSLGVFQIKRLPHWAQAHFPLVPDYLLAVMTILLGLVDMILAVVAP